MILLTRLIWAHGLQYWMSKLSDVKTITCVTAVEQLLMSLVSRLSVLVVFFVTLIGCCAIPAADRPNIIVIKSDDLGYSDIGCFGGEIETPNLDTLAENGLRLTQFYNTARCCPTRASLLTGLYAHQAEIGHMVDSRAESVGQAYAGELSHRAVTIAEVLRTAGYNTDMAGKWHVTKKTSPVNDAGKHNWPQQRGFDRFYGTIHGAGSFFDPNTLVRDNTFISPFADPEYQPDLFYYTDAINDHAARFVTEHRQQSNDKPFFLYVAHTAAHWPMHAKESDIEKYSGLYDAGYDAIRAARLERMNSLGLLDSQTAHLIDVMATCVDLANAKYPQEFKNTPIQALEGISLRPAFEGSSIDRQTPLYGEYEGNRAIRFGPWKLVSEYPGDWELYNIECDRTEMVDLATRHPARVQEMSDLWEAWADRVGVEPWAVVAEAGRKPKK